MSKSRTVITNSTATHSKTTMNNGLQGKTFKPSLSLSQALKVLEQEATSGRTWLEATGKPEPTRMSVGDMKTMIAVFQPRTLEGRIAEDAEHIKSLAAVIRRNDVKFKGGTKQGTPTFLDPILVWWSGLSWYVVDGHHMRLAYLQSKLFTVVPVEIFSGTIAQAMQEAIKRNAKDKLVMRKDDKLNAAWRMVLSSELTIPEIVRLTSISSRQVSNMRRTKVELSEGKVALKEGDHDVEAMTQEALLDMTWKEARIRLLRFEGEPNGFHGEDADAFAWKQAEVMCKAICKAVGSGRIIQSPDILAKALILIEERLPNWLMSSADWSPERDGLLEELDDEEDELDLELSEIDEVDGSAEAEHRG